MIILTWAKRVKTLLIKALDLKAERKFRWISFLLSRYPCYNDKLIDQMLHDYSSPHDEQEQISSLSNRNLYLLHILLIIFMSICSASYVRIGVTNLLRYQIKNIKYIKPDRTGANDLQLSLHPSTIAHKQFECLQTNCSILFDTNLDILKVPLDGLCNPGRRKYLMPFIDLGQLGFFIYIVCGFVLFSYCVIQQLVQIIYPTGDATLMYALAPKWSIKFTRARLRSYYIDYLSSMLNFRNNLLEKLEFLGFSMDKIERKKIETLIRSHCPRREIELLLHIKYDQALKTTNKKQPATGPEAEPEMSLRSKAIHALSPGSKQKFNSFLSKTKEQSRETGSEIKLDLDFSRSVDQQLDMYLNDCTALIRTDWWRKIMCKTCKIVLYVAIASSIYAFVSSYYNIYYVFVRAKSNEFVRIGSNIRNTNCTLRIDSNRVSSNLSAGQIPEWLKLINGFYYVKLENYNISCSLICHLQLGLSILSWSTLTIIANAGVVMCQYELVTWVKELIGQLEFALEYKLISNLMLSSKRRLRTGSFGSNFPMASEPSQFSIARLRNLQRIHKCYVPLFGAITGSLTSGNKDNKETKSRLLNRLIFNQKLSINFLSKDKYDTDSSIELLEKLYLKVRLFYSCKDYYGRSMILLNMIRATVCFIGAFVITVMCRQTGFLKVLLVYTILWLTYIIGSILVGANFNSVAKPIITRLWSIVALLNGSDDLRVEHLQKLWLDLAEMIVHEGGFGLRVLGFKINYLLITQVMIAFSTLMVFFIHEDDIG